MRFWKELWWERHYPWGIAFAVALLIGIAARVFPCQIGFPQGADANFLLGASITAGSIFTSFLATSLTFFKGVKTPVAELIRKTEYNNNVLSYFKWAVLGALGLCLFSLVGVFVGPSRILYFCGWVFFVLFSGLSFWRCVSLLLKMLRNPDPER